MDNIQALEFYVKNTFIIEIKSDGYQFKDGDQIYFTAKPKPDNDKTDADAVIKKSWTVGTDADYGDDGYLQLRLEPTNTDIDFGCYFYDVKLVTESISETIIAGKLKALPVATLEH